MYQIDTKTTQTRAPQLTHISRNTNPHVSTSTGVIHKTNVSRPQLRSTQMKEKVMQNNSHVKDKKTEVEDHPRISSISNKTKSVTASNDSLKSRTSNVNVVCATCGNVFQVNIMINKVYYVEGLNYNLFLVGQFFDADLEVAFRKSTCFVRDLQGNDLLTNNRGSDLYTIPLQETTSSTLICLMAKASLTQAWLWHRRLSHLNFDYINLLSKKDVVIGLPKLKYVKDQLYDYSRYTWTLFLRSKDEAPKVLKEFLIMIQQNLQALVIFVRTDKGTEFLNKTLHAFFKEEGIEHQTSTPRTPEQNIIVERQNRTLVEAARTMLSASKLPLFFWAKAISTACYTQNRSIIIPTHEKMAYHIINDRKPLIKYLHIFCTSSVNNSSSPTDNSKQQEPTTLTTNVNAKENNNNQANDIQFHQDEFINPFYTLIREIAESSSCNIDNSYMHTFYQPHDSEYQWTKDHPLEQVHGNPSKPVQTRRQLATDPKMCMSALTVSTAEPKTIKEAMVDYAMDRGNARRASLV
ncbi:retrovirus-related pol polyprotein from transposon TNT 1-94 [Tanacetum coccineum]